MTTSKQGSVHGRFQPFHLGHLEYVLEAKARCDLLWIGLTQYQDPNPLGLPRERPEANPLTFHERVQLITDVLLEAGVPREEFAFVPFPIERPGLLPEFLALEIECFTTICDNWNRQKIAVLEAAGYDVTVLFERETKQHRGSMVRDSIALGTDDWKEMVPPATARWVETLDLRQRLIELRR